MIPIFDNGHGGLINGVYQTAGKRSPAWAQGTLFEGVFNREIVNGVIERLKIKNQPYYHVSDEPSDTPLGIRVAKANRFAREIETKYDTIGYLLSIHANAGGGTGWEIFTTVGKTKSDAIADVFIKNFKSLPIPHRADLSDGDGDKESNFYVLKHSACPAILIECAFMDNPTDYALLNDKDFKERLISNIYEAIIELYKIKDI
jgi:N-acetylmuramoyl-L-alanine amidase